MAIVGARACTEYGKEAAGFYAGELANAGVNIISGMAAGVDGYAHRGAIERGKPTYAVLGCGVNVCYPRENYKIFMPWRKTAASSRSSSREPARRHEFPHAQPDQHERLADAVIIIFFRSEGEERIPYHGGLCPGAGKRSFRPSGTGK